MLQLKDKLEKEICSRIIFGHKCRTAWKLIKEKAPLTFTLDQQNTWESPILKYFKNVK